MSSSVDEKGGDSNNPDNDSVSVYERPKGLRGVYYHPITQIVMLAFVCFLCPGMFNALTGLGGGGQVNPTTSANSTCAVYATYAFFAFFSGTVNNKIGAKRTLLFGTLGYALYVGSYLQVLFVSYHAINIHPGAGWFVVTSGALLGVTAAFLWTAQGALMLSYCTEAQKGIFISIFWAIFNLGAVVGAAVSFGQNIHSTVFSNGTYIGILILTILGVSIPLLMADPDKMIRTDGTRVFNDYNSALFNIRARSLNNFMYWLSQIIGSGMIGVILDSKRLRRRVRAFTGTYTRASVPPDSQKMDIYNAEYPAHVWLMIFYGLLDAMWQTTSFWLIGAMSNDTNKLAIYSGFYHSIQSAGAAGVWRMDAIGLPYMNIFLSTWCLVVAGLVFAFPMIYLRIRDTTVLEDEGLIQRDQEINNMKAKGMIEGGNEIS
ncbi:hypothetical protein BDR07DRAFT_1431872 [Suillus spraguei]|nr:hypothetical protein BDR07DRAFT_1431872 [Suillus spraguei]